MNVDYKHTWVLPRNSIVVRFYMWLWGASPRDVTFCKLFWGYVFCVPCMVGRLIGWPLWVIGNAIMESAEKRADLPASPEKVARKRARDQRAQRNLRRIETTGVHFVMAFTTVWRYLRYPFVVVCGLAVLASMTLLVRQLATAWSDVTVDVLLYAGLFVALMVFVALPAGLGLAWLTIHGKFTPVRRSVDWATPRVLVTLAAPFVFFFWVMKMGFISVKSNTCPRIELSDEKTDAPSRRY